jgi:hypothetical protein
MKQKELLIDENLIYLKEYKDVKIGECIFAYKRPCIVEGHSINTRHGVNRFNVKDFCTKKDDFHSIAHISQRSQDYEDVRCLYVADIITTEYLLMSFEDEWISVIDLKTNELKENVIVNVEGQEYKNNLKLAQSLLNDGKEVIITIQSAAGVNIITHVVGN